MSSLVTRSGDVKTAAEPPGSPRVARWEEIRREGRAGAGGGLPYARDLRDVAPADAELGRFRAQVWSSIVAYNLALTPLQSA